MIRASWPLGLNESPAPQRRPVGEGKAMASQPSGFRFMGLRSLLCAGSGRQAIVLGLGRFGGGAGVVRFLAQRGFLVEVIDDGAPEALAASEASLADVPGLCFRLGPGSSEAARERLASASLLVVNPAVKPGHPLWLAAEAAGVPVTTEIGLLVAVLPPEATVVGITGSAGKSTTSSMAAAALAAWSGAGGVMTAAELETPAARSVRESTAGVVLGGNLGGSLLPHVDRLGRVRFVVLELSSFMGFHLQRLGWSPHVAVLTNLSANHLDWHGDMAAYSAAKAGLFEQLAREDVAILPEGLDPGWVGAACSRQTVVAVPDDLPELRVPGHHNRMNAAFALRAAEAALKREASRSPRTVAEKGPGERRSAALAAVAAFAGLPHRLQAVEAAGGEGGRAPSSAAERWPAGTRFYNDSKATTPEAALLAIQAFEPGTVRVILGGADKGASLEDLGRRAAELAAGVYTLGATGDALAAAAEHAAGGGVVRRCGTLDQAMVSIRAELRPGEVVLLSPGCASWDQFENYERRGEAFAAAVAAFPLA